MIGARILDVEVLHDHWLRLWFRDGMVADVDVWPLIARGTLFEPIRSCRARFEQARSDGVTVVWPGNIDLSPYVLHGDEAAPFGTRFERRLVRAADPALA